MPETRQPSGYFPDIDGLRALAVVAVLLFHLEVPGFAGGYVGICSVMEHFNALFTFTRVFFVGTGLVCAY